MSSSTKTQATPPTKAKAKSQLGRPKQPPTTKIPSPTIRHFSSPAHFNARKCSAMGGVIAGGINGCVAPRGTSSGGSAGSASHSDSSDDYGFGLSAALGQRAHHLLSGDRDDYFEAKENFLLHRYLYNCNANNNGNGNNNNIINNKNENAHFHNKVKGLKLIHGMTEYSNNNNNNNITNIKLVAGLPLQNRNTNIRRNLNNQPQQQQATCKLDNVKNQFNNDNINNNHISHNNNQIVADKHKFEQYQLNDDDLKTNVQIVLNNINKNYNLLKEYIINDKLNKNNGNTNCSTGNLKTTHTMSSPESDCNSNPYKMAPLGGLCSIASSQDFTHDNSDYQWFLDYGYRDGITHQSVLSSLSASYNGIGELSYYDDLAKNLDANLAEVDMESFCAEDINSLLKQIPINTNSTQRKNSFNQNTIMEMDNSICKSELLFSPVKEISHISIDSLDMDGCYADDIILTCQANKNNYTIAFEGSYMYSDESFYDDKMKQQQMQYQQQQQQQHQNNLDNLMKKRAIDVSMSHSDAGFTTWSKLKIHNNTINNNVTHMNNNNNNNHHQHHHHQQHSHHNQYYHQQRDDDDDHAQFNQIMKYTSDNNNLINNNINYSNTNNTNNNNNINNNVLYNQHDRRCIIRKSSSMPNIKAALLQQHYHQQQQEQQQHHQQQLQLQQQQMQKQQLNVSQAISNSSIDSYGKLRTLLPMYTLPNENPEAINSNVKILFNQNGEPIDNDDIDDVEDEDDEDHLNTKDDVLSQQQQQLQQQQQQQQQPSFNLVKLFIKQKSSSTDTCMDVSSGCWPSDSTNSSSIEHGNNNVINNNSPNTSSSHNGGSTSNTNNNNINNNNNHNNSNSNGNRLRKKSMNDSGKSSALSRQNDNHEGGSSGGGGGGGDGDDNNYQFDSLDAQINNNNNNNININNNSGNSSSSCSNNNKPNDFNREIFDSPTHKRSYKDLNLNIRNQIKNPALYNLMINKSNNNSLNITNSDTSRTSENLTQIFNINPSKTKVPIDMITKSMQTSSILTNNNLTAMNNTMKEKVRIIPPSFLAQLNKLGDQQKAPVFVVYPNYALPDLEFIKIQNEVILSPLGYKEIISNKKRRPFSMNDLDTNIKTKDYSHVIDWKSLMTLLPNDYRKLLKNIPNIKNDFNSNDVQLLSQKPMFCMTPPLRRHGPRGVTCDCVNIMNNAATYNSSSSGGSSSQPPSSGYRGSSTILTDSEMDTLGRSNNMYVYQYENSTERPPSGRNSNSSSNASSTTPKGILRRANTARPSTGTKSKRNSMFEEPNQYANNVDKRRSLQEPYYMAAVTEDYISEMQEINQRLPNTPKQRDYVNKTRLESLNAKQNMNCMTELSDMELNKAFVSNFVRNGNPAGIDGPEGDAEARMRAETFLSNVPKSELKHYAEIANILETVDEGTKDNYDRSKLRNEVSRTLSQRKVQFNQNPNQLRPTDIKFTTPPNSPNMSITTTLKVDRKLSSNGHTIDKEKEEKIQSNRFKRLQIQWELLSKDSISLNKDFEKEEPKETKSGGSTPTSGASGSTLKSRIPRPVSYPAAKPPPTEPSPKTTRSPSRLATPKKYTPTTTTTAAAAANPSQPRTPSKVNTTPKRSIAPRTATRTR